jgi:hypothetical protein
MKTSTLALALILGSTLAGSAFAQCTNDGTVTAPPLPQTINGNTCGKNLALTSICSGGNGTNGAGTSVIQLTLGAASAIQLQVVSTTAGFNPELAFISGLCSSLTGCTVDDTNNTQTVPASGTDSPSAQPAAGSNNFVFVTDLNTEAPGCGNYGLTVSGTLPVQLQNFSVQ